MVDGLAGAIAHPIDTARGVVSLIDSAAQTTSQGQAVQFFADVTFGRFNSYEEAAQAWQERQDPLKLAQAKLDLATDLGKALFAESIRLAQEGKYSEATGMLLGQNTDALLGAAGVLKGGRLRTLAPFAERTPPGTHAGTLAPKSGGAESFGPKDPRSPLGRDVIDSFPDPDPTTYRSGLRPGTPVTDHVKARALGGDPVDPANLHQKAWSENARKGWHEGEYLRQRRELMRQGLTRAQAEWVLEDYLRWIMNDIHATPVDPKKLNKLPSP
jgi:hypothetical protein